MVPDSRSEATAETNAAVPANLSAIQHDTSIEGMPLECLLRRKVLILDGKDETVEIVSLRSRAAVVLLGDPGMGKSTSLAALAQVAGSERQSVRAFLASPLGAVDGQTRFLDALDEAMAVRNDLSLLDQAAGRLGQMGWPPFWLSCRHVDWARTDGKSLLQETLRGNLTVAQLLPLDRADVLRTASCHQVDGAAFIKAMEQADLMPILGNPESLHLTLEIFNEFGAPTCRSDLYDKATYRLASENNRAHAHAGSAPSAVATRDFAGGLAATLLLAGEDEIVARGHSIGRGTQTDAFQAQISPEQMEAILATRLFTSPEPGVWTFCHRTIAEYLGARFLADRIGSHGLSLTRALGMICDSDAKPKSSLRGLFAWFAACLPGRAHEFAELDPYAIVTYGDTTRLPLEALRALFQSFRRLVEVDPFFRSGRWHDPGFKAFGHPDFEHDLQEVLNERPIRPHLLSCVFDALEQGGGLPTLAGDLDALISDCYVAHDTRRAAVYAYIKCASDADAVGLFKRMLENEAADPYRQLSGILLHELYPAILGLDDLRDFIVQFSEMVDERPYGLCLHLYLADRIPAGTDAEILDAMNSIPSCHVANHTPSAPQVEIKRLARALFARAVTGEPFVEPEKAATWLPLIDMDGESVLGQEDLKAALAHRSDCYVPFLLRASNTEGVEPKARPHSAVWLLQRHLPHMIPPADIAERMISLIEADPTSSDAGILYASTLHHMIRQDHKDLALFERFYAVGDRNDHLGELRESMLIESVETARWRWEDRERLATRAEETARNRARTNALLHAELEGIRSGTALHALDFLAKTWFGHLWFDEESKSLGRAARLSQLFSPEILSAAEEGFKLFVRSAAPYRPEDFVNWLEQNGHPATVYPMLVGADLFFEDDPDGFLDLGIDRLMSLLNLGLAFTTLHPEDQGRIENRPWICNIIQAYPDETIVALAKLLQPQLERSSCSPVGIDQLLSDDALAPARDRLLPSMLRWAHPANPYFRQIVRAAVEHIDGPTFRSVVLERFSEPMTYTPDERWRLLLLSWRLVPDSHQTEVRALASSDDNRLFELMAEMGSDQDGFHPSVALPVTLNHRIVAVELAGPRFAPQPMPGRSWSPPTDYDRANFVHRHILAIGETPGVDSGAALNAFLENPALTAFQSNIKHALANWERNNRLADAETPSPERVAQSLAGGPPATSGELHAFVLDHLRDIERALKTGRGNDWMAFWNVDGHSKPTQARPENRCRDSVAVLFSSRLERAGLSSEMEARHVGETRCDITVRGLDVSIPIEAKCDWNPDLWTGWRTQLRDRYACEPQARGFGIYLVFWFGDRRGTGHVVADPLSGHAPTTAHECQQVLLRVMAEEWPKLVPIVYDLTPLPSRSEERKALKSAMR